MLPSMPLLFSNSQQGDASESINQQNGANDDQKLKFPVDEVGRVNLINDPAAKELCSSFEILSDVKKDCENDPVNLTENVPCSDKRKIIQQTQPQKKKKRLEGSQADITSNDANHFADAYFMKAKSLLGPADFQQFISVLSETVEEPGAAVALFHKMTELLKDYPQLIDDFVGFLHPHQAKECGKLIELQFFKKCWSFLKMLDISHGNRFNHFLEQQSAVTATSESIKTSILPMFKGSPFLSEAFLQLLPDEKPQPCSKEDYEDISETTIDDGGWERIRIPEHPESRCDQNCNCICHSSNHFCVSCNLRFRNGQIYLQHGKILRFARVNFGDSPLEDLLQKLHPALYSKRREKKKPSKPINNQSKEALCEDENAVHVKEDLQPVSSPDRCDFKAEEEDDYWEDDEVSSGDKSSTGEPFDCSMEDPDTCDSTKFICKHQPLSPIPSLIDEESQKAKLKLSAENLLPKEIEDNLQNTKIKKIVEVVKVEVDSEKVEHKEHESNENDVKNVEIEQPRLEDEVEKRLWTREEDKMILQAFQKEIGTEQTFSKISNLMPSRSVNDIQGRFQVLMNLLEKVASGSHDSYPT